MGFNEILIWSPEVIRIAIVMGFGIVIWVFAMRELLKKNEDSEEGKVVVNLGNKSGRASGSALQLTYITEEQIVALTIDQLKEIPESEVEKLTPNMKALFRKHKNEVMLADRAKNSK